MYKREKGFKSTVISIRLFKNSHDSLRISAPIESTYNFVGFSSKMTVQYLKSFTQVKYKSLAFY